MKCCICGNEIIGYGNNPAGALDENANVIEWNPGEVCCNDCNEYYVVLPRFAMDICHTSKKNIKKILGDRLIKRN